MEHSMSSHSGDSPSSSTERADVAPPPTASLRLKLGAVRMPNEGSLEEVFSPTLRHAPAPTAAAKAPALRLRLRPNPVPEPTATAEKEPSPEPPVKANCAEATREAAPAPKQPSPKPSPKASPRVAKKPPPPLFPSAPQTRPGAAVASDVSKPTPPGDSRPTTAASAQEAMAAPAPTVARLAPRPANVDPPPPMVPLTKVQVPALRDELDKYDIQKKVGEGTYGEVYLAREKKSGAPVAIKRLKVLEQMEGLANTTLREITILHSLKNLNEAKHFTALREVIMAPDYRSMHLVFEFVEHSLYGLMVQGVRFTEADLRCVFRQVLKGLTVLHEAHIVHRDIKPNNILLDSSGVVKLCDFGLAFSTTSGRQRITPRLVALAYRPPEMLLNAKTYSAAVDVWSVGCMLAQVYLGGAPPFMRNAKQPADSEVEQLNLIGAAYGIRAAHIGALIGILPEGVEPVPASPVADVVCEQHLTARLERHLVSMARDRRQPPIPKPVLSIICRALSLDPARRPSARELLRSGWFMNAVNEAVERAAMARRIRETIGDRFCHGPAAVKR